MQKYKVKKHAGKRSRPVVSLSLAPAELAALDKLAKCEGLTRSRAVARLVRGLK